MLSECPVVAAKVLHILNVLGSSFKVPFTPVGPDTGAVCGAVSLSHASLAEHSYGYDKQ